MPASALPPHLRKNHNDWPWFLRWVPRGWTAVNWGPPKRLLGNQKPQDGVIKPIGKPNTWQVSYYPGAPLWAKLTGLAFYAAYSSDVKKDGQYRHFRLGTRHDDIDNYSTLFSIASRRFPGEGERDTST